MAVVNITNQDYGSEVFQPSLTKLLFYDNLTDLRFVSTDLSGDEAPLVTNAHSCVFTWKSPFLRDLVEETKSMQLASDPVYLYLPGVEHSSVSALIEYFYLGKTTVSSKSDLEDLCDLLGIVDIDLDDDNESCVEISFDEEADIKSPDPMDQTKSNGLLTPQKEGSSPTKEQGQIDSKKRKKRMGEFLRQCSSCSIFFLSKKSYVNHTKWSKCRRPAIEVKEENSSNSKRMKCYFCEMTFDKPRNLKNHTLNHFKPILYPLLPSSKPFTCPDCSCVSRDRVTLLRHFCFLHKHIFEHVSQEELNGVVLS